MTPDELEALGDAAPPWFAAALYLGAWCGLRQAEAAGLTVDRVDFLRRSLTVNRQLVTVRYGVTEFGPLKTARSYRTVPLADVALDALARHVREFGTGVGGLLLHEDGRPVHAAAVRDPVAANPTAGRATAARFHDARHTYASVLLSAGVSVPAAAEYLGDSPAVLLGTYAHLLPDDHDRARAAVEGAFAPAN